MIKRTYEELQPYFPPGHFGVTCKWYHGKDETGAAKFWIGVSEFEPDGGADWAYEDNPLEKVYYVLEGEMTVTDKDGSKYVIHANESISFPPNEGRGLKNESGKPAKIVDAGGSPSAVDAGGAFIDSATSFAMIRGGHVDATILGGLEVDADGSLSNWIIPGKKMPGMGGAMDLLVGAKNVIVAMEHTAKGKPKILKKCKLPYTAVKCVDKIITEMAVIEVTENELLLTEYNPEFSVEQVQAATEAELIISPDLKPMCEE